MRRNRSHDLYSRPNFNSGCKEIFVAKVKPRLVVGTPIAGMGHGTVAVGALPTTSTLARCYCAMLREKGIRHGSRMITASTV